MGTPNQAGCDAADALHKWPNGVVTYRYDSAGAPRPFRNERAVRKHIADATAEWSRVAQVTFIPTRDADLVVKWGRNLGEASGVAEHRIECGDARHLRLGYRPLGAATLTLSADVLETNPAVIGRVLVHELGHVIGLGHSDNPVSVMHHGSFASTPEADDAELAGILYGAKRVAHKPSKPPSPLGDDQLAEIEPFLEVDDEVLPFTGTIDPTNDTPGWVMLTGVVNAGGYGVTLRDVLGNLLPIPNKPFDCPSKCRITFPVVHTRAVYGFEGAINAELARDGTPVYRLPFDVVNTYRSDVDAELSTRLDGRTLELELTATRFPDSGSVMVFWNLPGRQLPAPPVRLDRNDRTTRIVHTFNAPGEFDVFVQVTPDPNRAPDKGYARLFRVPVVVD